MKDKIFPAGTALSDVYAGLHAAMPRPLDSELPQRVKELIGGNEFTFDDLKLLTREERKRMLNGTRAEIAALEEKLREKKKMHYLVSDLAEAWGMDFSKEWDYTTNKIVENLPVEIQNNDCSRLHKLSQAIQDNTLGWVFEEEGESFKGSPIAKDVHSFVITQDWTKLFNAAEEIIDGVFQTPFEKCAFEFRVNNRTVIVLTIQQDNAEHPSFMAFYEAKDGRWCNISTMGAELWERLVRTISVMLETEVAVHEVKRVPHKLAAKRAASGKLPMYDFHTLSLAKRFRTSKGAPGNATGAHKRLHFVRGHWRHYEEHKTWIKWHLRGDESLGFADKNYKV